MNTHGFNDPHIKPKNSEQPTCISFFSITKDLYDKFDQKMPQYKDHKENRLLINQFEILTRQISEEIRKGTEEKTLKKLFDKRNQIMNDIEKYDEKIMSPVSICHPTKNLDFQINVEPLSIIKDYIIINNDNDKNDQNQNKKENNNDIEEKNSKLVEEPDLNIDQKTLDEIYHINKKYFHHDNFKGMQLKAIKLALERKDLFIMMPTGGGKSLCYQLPGKIQGGLTVVISPLKSLIFDQIKKLEKLNLSVKTLCSELINDYNDYLQILNDIESGKVLFLYITPEKLIQTDVLNFFTRLYNKNQITRFVFDEAHLMIDYGLDFRPDYLKLSILKDKYKSVPIMALTGSITNSSKNFIIDKLKIQNCAEIRQSLKRENLVYQVKQKSKEFSENCEKIDTWIRHYGYKNESGIIFCMTRIDTQKVSEYLLRKGYKVSFYHSKIEKENKILIQNNWMNDNIKIIVATNAFGMGVDKPDVRFVIHYSMPKSLEEYFQESGRGGRDKHICHCLLLFGLDDYVGNYNLISFDEKGEDKDENIIKRQKYLLDKMFEYSINSTQCRQKILLQYFNEDFVEEKCKKCDNCQKTGQSSCFCLTSLCKNITSIIFHVNNRKGSPYATINYVFDIFVGSKSSKIRKSDLQSVGYGTGAQFKGGKQYKFQYYEKILSILMIKKIINISSIKNIHGTIYFLVPGENMKEEICIENSYFIEDF